MGKPTTRSVTRNADELEIAIRNLPLEYILFPLSLSLSSFLSFITSHAVKENIRKKFT